MDRATLEYGVRAGLIFCLAREFDHRLNSIILEKAIRYRQRGVVGIDLAGTETRALELDADQVGVYQDLFQRAREAGLKTTVHTGETRGTGAEGVMAVVERLRPAASARIRAADESAMRPSASRTVLELCPPRTSTHAVSGADELKHIVQTLTAR
jgi:adenosine deaminase